VISDLRQAIADAVETVDLRCAPYLVDQVNAPQGMVARKTFLYDTTQEFPVSGRSTDMGFAVVVYAGRVSERASQIVLDDLCDPDSDTFLKTAIETHQDLLDLCDSVTVSEAGELTVITVGTVDYLTTEFPIVILH
jgi:hypothetical protein